MASTMRPARRFCSLFQLKLIFYIIIYFREQEMFTVIYRDSVPGPVSAGGYPFIYIPLMCLAVVLALIVGKNRKRAAPFTIINIGLIIGFACNYNAAINEIKLSYAVEGVNTTIYSSVIETNCTTRANCSCVKQCTVDWLCDNTPCLVNFSPIQGVYQCEAKYVTCYNQTLITSLTYNANIYLYDNTTYTFATKPANSSTSHKQSFLPWDPETDIKALGEGKHSLFGLIVLSIFYSVALIILLYYSCYSHESTNELPQPSQPPQPSPPSQPPQPRTLQLTQPLPHCAPPPYTAKLSDFSNPLYEC